MIQFEMIQEGDRLLLGLSGGKDSLTLLHCLLEFQKKLPIKFDLEVMIVRAPLIKLVTNIHTHCVLFFITQKRSAPLIP